MPHTEEQERKGKLIQRRRERMGISQEQLATRIGVAPRTVQNVEAGDTWRQGTVDRIMDELGLSDDDLNPTGATTFSADAVDAEIWARFPDDVQVALLGVGAWLTKHHAFAERRRLAADLNEWMQERDRTDDN